MVTYDHSEIPVGSHPAVSNAVLNTAGCKYYRIDSRMTTHGSKNLVPFRHWEGNFTAKGVKFSLWLATGTQSGYEKCN